MTWKIFVWQCGSSFIVYFLRRAETTFVLFHTLHGLSLIVLLSLCTVDPKHYGLPVLKYSAITSFFFVFVVAVGVLHF